MPIEGGWKFDDTCICVSCISKKKGEKVSKIDGRKIFPCHSGTGKGFARSHEFWWLWILFYIYFMMFCSWILIDSTESNY